MKNYFFIGPKFLQNKILLRTTVGHLRHRFGFGSSASEFASDGESVRAGPGANGVDYEVK